MLEHSLEISQIILLLGTTLKFGLTVGIAVLLLTYMIKTLLPTR